MTFDAKQFVTPVQRDKSRIWSFTG